MAGILGFGAYLPERIVTSGELAERLGVAEGWVTAASGIRERRCARETETVADLGVQAALDCLAFTHVEPRELGLLIIASGSAEHRFPGPAAVIGHRLGVAGIPAIDLPMASAGSLFGLALAGRLAGTYGKTLLVASEKMTPMAWNEPLDRNTAILFGDGAGACLIGDGDAGLRILDSVLHSDGAFAADLRLGLAGGIEMNGLSVILQAARKIPAAIGELLERNMVSPDRIAAFLMHQANQNLTERVSRALGVPAGRFFSNIATCGNTSAASMLIASSDYFRSKKVDPGDLICFAAFGAGFHWGALLAQVVAAT